MDTVSLFQMMAEPVEFKILPATAQEQSSITYFIDRDNLDIVHIVSTVCPRRTDPSYYVKWVTSSWTYSMSFLFTFLNKPFFPSLYLNKKTVVTHLI